MITTPPRRYRTVLQPGDINVKHETRVALVPDLKRAYSARPMSESTKLPGPEGWDITAKRARLSRPDSRLVATTTLPSPPYSAASLTPPITPTFHIIPPTPGSPGSTTTSLLSVPTVGELITQRGHMEAKLQEAYVRLEQAHEAYQITRKERNEYKEHNLSLKKQREAWLGEKAAYDGRHKDQKRIVDDKDKEIERLKARVIECEAREAEVEKLKSYSAKLQTRCTELHRSREEAVQQLAAYKARETQADEARSANRDV